MVLLRARLRYYDGDDYEVTTILQYYNASIAHIAHHLQVKKIETPWRLAASPARLASSEMISEKMVSMDHG
jgi:hypothetical protein